MSSTAAGLISEHHDRDEDEDLWQHALHVAGGDGGGDEHEQHSDQQLDERLLELEQRGADQQAALVAYGDAHERRCRQAGVVVDEVGAHDRRHDDHQRRRDDHAWRAPLNFADQEQQQRRRNGCEQHTDADAGKHLAWLPAVVRGHALEDEYAEQRTDRIDERSFPLQEGADIACWADEGEQRQHDGWTRHDEDRPDQKRRGLVHVVEEQRDGCGDADPGHDDAPGYQARDDLAHAGSDLAKRQPQPCVEQDDANGHRDERLVERAEQLVGLHVLSGDAGEEPDRQQQDDRRHPQASRQQLGADRQDEYEPQTQQDVVGRHRARIVAPRPQHAITPIG